MSNGHCSPESLSAYLDKELTLQEALLLEKHLERCPKCKEKMSLIKSISDAVQDIPRPHINPLFAKQISSSLQKSKALNERIFIRLFESWGMLSLFILCLTLIFFGSTILSVFYVSLKIFAIIGNLLLKISMRLPAPPINIVIGLIFLLGAIIIFYGFTKIYITMTRKELVS